MDVFVQWPYDADPMTDAEIDGSTRIAAANQTDLDKLASVTITQLARVAANEVEMAGVDLGPIQGGATAAAPTNVANGPAGQNRKYEAGPGFYRINGTVVEAAVGRKWTLWWNGSAWSLHDMGALSSSRTKIIPYVAGTYTKDEVVEVGTMIYRANKTTTAAPMAGNVMSPDWELIGGGKLDQEGGALSWDKGEDVLSVLEHFLTTGTLTPGASQLVDKTTQAFAGVTPLENTGLFANGTTFGYDQDFRIWTYLNVPVTQPDGRKIMTVRFQGPGYTDPSMAMLVGVRNDNTVVPLIPGAAGGGDRDVTVSVAGYKALHMSMDAETATSNPRMTVTFSAESDTGMEENAVKKYIDNGDKIPDWTAGSYEAGKLRVGPDDGLIYRANKTTSQEPSQGASDWDVIGGGRKEFVLVSEHPSTEFSIPVEGEFIKSTDFIRGVAGMKVEITSYGDGDRPQLELYDENKLNPERLADFNGRSAEQPTTVSVLLESDGWLKAYNNSWQSGNNEVMRLYQVNELSRADVDKPGGIASYESVEEIKENVGGEPQVTKMVAASGYSVMDGEYWRWTAPIPVKKGDRIENVALGDAGAWAVAFSTDPALLVPGAASETLVPVTSFMSNGGLEVLTGRINEDGYIVGRTNNFFGDISPSYIKVSTDKRFVEYADIADILANNAGGSLSNKTKLDLPTPTKTIRIDFETAAALPTAKGTVIEGTYTYNDNAGTVFKKPGNLEVQGSSSASYVKKNWTFGFFNDEALEEECPIRLGNLVEHTEFVFKSNYIDATHSRNIVCNRIWEDMIQARPAPFKRENERAKGFNPSNGTLIDRFDSGALCHVQGYPAVFYVNGEFYGMGNLNIGKKRQNYDLTKSNQNHIQLAADDHANFNLWQGEPVWEIRNPGTPDANFTGKVNAWFNTNALTGTAWKDAFPTNHDLINCIDYMLLIDFLYAYDCFAKNFILTSWDGVKFFFTPYDLDSTMGLSWEGRSQTPWNESCRSTGGTAASQQFYQKLYTQYNAEVKARYAELKAKNILTVDNVYRHLDEFAKIFGLELYKQEFAKWPNIPSNNPNATGNPYGDGGFYSSRFQILTWFQNKVAWMDLPTNYGA